MVPSGVVLNVSEATQKAQVLIEATRWIRRFRDRLVVIKLGGSALEDPEVVRNLLKDVVFMETVGVRLLLIHGGGKAINAAMKKSGIQPRFVQGRRYTDPETLEIVTQVLAGEICGELVTQINAAGGQAVGLSYLTQNVLLAEKLFLADENGVPLDLGFVGQVVEVNRDLLLKTIDAGKIPVIPSVAVDWQGQKYNVNADTAAAAVARALDAEKLIFLSDVSGIYRNRHDPGTLLSHLTEAECRGLIADGTIDSGMVPKVEAALDALKAGVQKVHVIDGRTPHSLLLEIFSDQGIGTEIVANPGVSGRTTTGTPSSSSSHPATGSMQKQSLHPAARRSSQATIDIFKQYVIPNYNRYPISLVHGEGSYVWDAEGNRYLDLFPGWGCNILGYSPPRLVQRITEQIAHLIHVPNTWYTEAQGDFAAALCSRSFGKAFFCNSGTEANEGAIKLARLHGSSKGRYKIITFENSFHGRTYAAVSATAQPKYHEGIGPLVPGFVYAPLNDLDAVRRLVDRETCAIMIEPVQGEGGVNIPDETFLAGLKQICRENDMLLVFDEVQTGMARLGTWFGYQQWNVQPDILTLAKGLAGGVACGAFIATEEVAPSLKPGKHASTFGGNALAMAAGLATVETIVEDRILENVHTQSARFREHFLKLQKELPIIREVRVRGMMIGVDLNIPGMPAVGKCMERGVLVNCTHETVIRLLPSLNIDAHQVDEGVAVVSEVLREMAAQHKK